MDKTTIDKIELLNKVGVTPQKIAKTLDITIDEVRAYFKQKAEEERRRQEELGFSQSKFSKSIRSKKLPPAKPKDEALEADIKKMRLLREMGYSPYTIATTFGTKYNKVYPYIRDIEPKTQHREPKFNLSKEDIEQIKFMKKEGFEPDQIARFLGVTEICVVTNIKKHNL